MEILNAQEMDPAILLGIVNERLRLGHGDLTDLAAEFGIGSIELEARLAELGFHYQPDTNQFKAR
ncbi:DUF4250 domain-containing protein [Ferrimonas balearica]|uniref:DUF4250 domain-containing protein n=1 Tax=Ferrimonas balearica TaxID=44012 RepID=UPI001C994C73|nr:DUF4250 domain-containing protein [Ferrimonas balearica]MBY5922912.1 DUF4250 domain-containing protein [Ferrimonas balearica]MBY5997711.1 DUF4250 domain-containing protein [Ferrimonas balearica]